jgi:hypothetical protein
VINLKEIHHLLVRLFLLLTRLFKAKRLPLSERNPVAWWFQNINKPLAQRWRKIL